LSNSVPKGRGEISLLRKERDRGEKREKVESAIRVESGDKEGSFAVQGGEGFDFTLCRERRKKRGGESLIPAWKGKKAALPQKWRTIEAGKKGLEGKTSASASRSRAEKEGANLRERNIALPAGREGGRFLLKESLYSLSEP